MMGVQVVHQKTDAIVNVRLILIGIVTIQTLLLFARNVKMVKELTLQPLLKNVMSGSFQVEFLLILQVMKKDVRMIVLVLYLVGNVKEEMSELQIFVLKFVRTESLLAMKIVILGLFNKTGDVYQDVGQVLLLVGIVQ